MINHESKIFLSYSRKNDEFALKLAKDLRAVGVNIWIDQIDVKVGQNWDDVTEDALNSSDIMLLILSPESVKSKNVKDEIAFALDEDILIVPIPYKACKVPLRIRRVQRSDFSNSYEGGLKDLFNKLNIKTQIKNKAKLPFEVLIYSQQFIKEIRESIGIANTIQEEFNDTIFENGTKIEFLELQKQIVKPSQIMNEIEDLRKDLNGYHPHLLLITDVFLKGNIFGSSRGEKGVGVVTTKNVANTILPYEKIKAYFIYYLARYTLNYINFEHKNHTDTRNCVYDRKGKKRDILKSMRDDAFCQECRNKLLSKSLTINQLGALNKLFTLSGDILNSE